MEKGISKLIAKEVNCSGPGVFEGRLMKTRAGNVFILVMLTLKWAGNFGQTLSAVQI